MFIINLDTAKVGLALILRLVCWTLRIQTSTFIASLINMTLQMGHSSVMCWALVSHRFTQT